MFVRTIKLARSALKRFVFCLLGVVMVALAVGLGARFTDEGPIRWIYYTPDRFAQARAEKKVILLEFTAQWCLNCHAMEQLVLRNERVVAALDRYGVEPIKVDLTGNNVVGNERLVAAGSRTIPYLVIYDRAGNAVFKSDAYTVDQVLDALERAAR